jgi:hypothetical protein
LERLTQLDRHEPHPLAQVTRLAHGGDGRDDLVPVSGSSGFVVTEGAATGIRGY